MDGEKKPTKKDNFIIDPSVKETEYYKIKKQSEEQPIFKDILDITLLKDAWNTSLPKDLAEATTRLMEGVYTKFYPIFMQEKEIALSKQKKLDDLEKANLQENLQKSTVTLITSRSGRSNNSEKENEGLQPPLSKNNPPSEESDQE